MNKKKIISLAIISVVILFIIIIAIVVSNNNKENTTENENENSKYPSYVTEIEDGVKLNKSSKMTEEKVFGNYTISNVQLTTKNGMSTLLANVKNNSKDKTELKVVEITLLNEQSEELITITGIIEALEPGGTTQLNTAITSDYVQAYDYMIKEK